MRDKAKNQNPGRFCDRVPARVGLPPRRPVEPPDVLPMPPGIYLTETGKAAPTEEVAAGNVRRLLLLVGGIVFVDTMFFAALTPLLPDYTDEFKPVQ